MNNVFECVGYGKTVINGEEVDVKLNFIGKLVYPDNKETITFELIENKVGEDTVLYELTLQP